ncbi:hypothetical protein PTKIN_Ptkin09bG0276500 [Pterospermum kingtungense]
MEVVNIRKQKKMEAVVNSIKRQARYTFNPENRVKHLHLQLLKLTDARDRLKHSVIDAEKRGEKIDMPAVKEWLTNAERVIKNAEINDSLTDNLHEAEKKCFILSCYNFKNRYRLNKKVEVDVEAINKLLEENVFSGRVSYCAPKDLSLSAGVEETFRPRINVFNGIMSALEDDSVSLVGVHGIGGIGKSTLMKEIASQVKDDKLFDAVVVVVVSHTSEIKDIQDQIAEQLNFEFDWRERRRDYQLLRKLKGMENILVILDDIGMKLDLETIGIPYGQHHKGCKILLASRSLDVLTEMNAQKIFGVGLLEREEARDLFEQIAGVGLYLQCTVIEVVKACQGLPIAISMVALVSTDKSSLQWRDALQKLKGPSKETTVLDQVIHSALKLSYDYLRSKELKLTFALCYALGHNAAVEDLWKCGMALGLFDDSKTIAQARDTALALVFELKKSSLLLDSCSDMFFDVHDVVRDYALSIASENHLLSVLKDENVMEYWSGKKIQHGNAIILRNAYVGKLPTKLNCPQLKIFYMACKSPSTIPDGFFCEMKELRVLYLNNVISFSLPSSIRVLENLRTLCLHECLLEDIAIIEQLRKLEILSLSGSDIKELPYEIGYLRGLRLLDLNNCTKLEYIGPGILSRLSKLEELYMMNCFCLWEIGRANLVELKELSDLTCLDIEIPNLWMMPKEDLFSGRLLRYKICIGNVGNQFRKHGSSKTVKLAGISDHLNAGLKELINETEELYLISESLGNLHRIFEGQSFQHLKNLHLDCFWGTNGYIFNPMEWNVAFPVLESLSISDVDGSEKICRVTPEGKLFDRLRTVKVEECSRLENLFSLSLFRNLLQLQEIEVVNCYGILAVVADEKEVFNGNPVNCNLLSLRLRSLPQLTSFNKQPSTSPEDEALFNEKITFPTLEELQLSGLGVRRIWQNQLTTTSCFGQNLRTLIVDDCHKLDYLWTDSMAGCFVQLKCLQITNCWLMKTVIQTEEKVEEIAEAKIFFPQLISLRLKSLPRLEGFYFGNKIIEFPTLKQVIVENCPKYTFSHGVLSTPKLRNIEIREDGGIRLEDLIAAVQKKDIGTESGVGSSKLWKKGETEVESFRPKIKAGASGTTGEEAVKLESDTNVKTLVSPLIEMSSPAIKQESDQRPVPETDEVTSEAEVISSIVRDVDKPYPVSATEREPSPPLTAEKDGMLSSHEVETEVAQGQKEEDNKVLQMTGNVSLSGEPTSTLALSTQSTRSLAPFETERVGAPPLTVENLEIVPDETEGTLSSHEIETEADHCQKEEDNSVLQQNVSQSSEPASTLALSTPSTRATMELVAAMDEAKVDILSQTEQVQEINETRVATLTTIEQCVSKILECMGTDRVRRIAVHGVWGVGKSSVLGALVDNLKTKHEFDLVIRVTVSKYWSLTKIRDQIIQKLPPASSNAEPFQILNDKKFLLLLDDVWERIDLREIGIPDPSQENGSMIILATRELKVCHDMEEFRVVKVEPVSREEAWKLLREQVGGLIDSPSIQHFAQGIVEGCCGLPLLIVVTGRALAGETNVSVWQHAFNEFSVPGRDIKSRIEDLIKLLKFSFDRLKSPSLKSCFLYCALFSEYQEINADEFLEYCIQEGLIAGSCLDAHARGYDIVDALLHALFLETTDNGQSIRMREVMRDLALGILSSDTEGRQLLLPTYSKPLNPEIESSSTKLSIADDHQFLLKAAAGLTELPTEEWKQSKMMFLMDNKLSTLPENPSCPALETLYLQRNSQLRVVPDHFFDNMPCLKVLNLSKTRIKFLPRSISNLGRLETLILCDCERLVKLPSEVGCLELLQVLNLRGTEIMELPLEIANLKSLNHLEVSFYGSSTSCEHPKLPHGFISNLQELKKLSISVYPGDNWWNKKVESLVKEVRNLKNLTALSFYFPEVEFLDVFLQESASWKEESLTEFKFVVGHDVKFNTSRVPQLKFGLVSGQCLRFVNSEKIPDAIVEVLARCTAFHLDHHIDIRRLSEFKIGNMKRLKYCIISECPDFETVVNCQERTDVVLPCLEHLSFHYSWSLTCIWEGVVPKGSFAALKTLALHACPKVTYVFKSSMLQFVSNLEELQVDDCEAIEKIVSRDEVTDTESYCISLKRLKLHCLPELVHIWEADQTKLLFEYFSVYDCPQLKQICLDSKLKRKLKEIRAEQDWWDNLVSEEKAILSDCEAIFIPICERDV